MRVLPLTVLLLTLGAAPATAAALPAGAGLPAGATADRALLAARGFRGAPRIRPRSVPGRRSAPSRYRARPQLGRRLVRGVLQGLGIAYLAHLLFGWGAGGSPVGLLLLFGLLAWFALRARARRAPARWRA